MGLVVELLNTYEDGVSVCRRVGFFHNNFNRDGSGLGEEVFDEDEVGGEVISTTVLLI
jgi:hypothetical protein